MPIMHVISCGVLLACLVLAAAVTVVAYVRWQSLLVALGLGAAAMLVEIGVVVLYLRLHR
jgi:hypothetical protein